VARIPVVFAPNFSVGVTLLTHLVAEVARGLPSVWELEIIETHHRAKVDAPSGTALALAEAAASARGWPLGEVLRGGRSGACGPRGEREIGVHAVRGGSVVGDHETRFLGAGETLTLSHRALDRDIFARGAWRAARFLLGLDGGPRPCAGVYDMTDVLGLR
jgi:4-hydroxy-tetrahydrodipicolinate reductase